uniref:glutathione transferase n=1 Tax=Oryza punctata TaxID=4537 RepID=A0A0E0K198_ORYPU
MAEAAAPAGETPAAEAKLGLYSYWRSSCSHRVRIALNLKGLEYEYKAVNLLKGEHSDPEFIKVNPMKFVPALVDGDAVIGDSYAIALYLEDKYPERALLPQDLKMKALNLQIASIVCSGIQPLHNLTVLRFIEQKVGTGESIPWTQQQIDRGFTDVFLAPQIYAAVTRFQINMSNYPSLARLHEEYMKHPAFQAALPDRQPDAPSST